MIINSINRGKNQKVDMPINLVTIQELKLETMPLTKEELSLLASCRENMKILTVLGAVGGIIGGIGMSIIT